ncbi:MAG: hypothetical protein ABIV26_02855 [Candidatus Limnocylindrales bacterium]
MTYEERVVRQTDEEVVVPTGDPIVPTGDVVVPSSQTVVSRQTTMRPSGGEVGRRIVVLVFGIIQALIVIRIVLLLLNAREGNDLVSFILNTSQIFVAPFVGIFNSDALKAGTAILDIAAIAALVGWTILEAIVLWIVNVFRRETV